MDSFFDTSVVIHYASFSKLLEKPLAKKCYNYIKNKKGKFLLGYYIEGEIKRRIKNRRIMYQEVLNKIINSMYEFDKSSLFRSLNDRDKKTAKQIYELSKGKKPEQVKRNLSEDQTVFEIQIETFLKFLIDDRLVEEENIRKELLSIIKEYGCSHADCMVLTSAIQAQESLAIFYFVAADKHFNSNEYDFLKKDPRIIEMKFPKLKNLLYED